MTRIPTPDQLNRDLADIVASAPRVRDGWRWAHPDAYRRPKHASAEIVSGGSPPELDATVASTAHYRSLLRNAAKAVLSARNDMLRAEACLNDAMALLDPPPTSEAADVRFLQHPADRGEVERARAAQGRRLARAERTGDWAEVTGA